MTAGTVMAEVSVGELIDKITILQIKLDRFSDPAKRANVARELDVLTHARAAGVAAKAGLDALETELRAVNETIWDLEDAIRDLIRRDDFGPAFVAATRAVHLTNEDRAAVKRRINDLVGSRLIEEKCYRRNAP